MRDWIRLAARFYPRSWRARYGDEFDALLEDAGGGAREFADVVGGALKMQLLAGGSWKLPAVAALAGAILAGAISLRLPERYVATAVVKAGANDLATQHLQEALSRSSLSEIIQRPSMQLYPRERYRMPIEDIIEHMRTHDIRVQRSGDTLTISFEYPDREKAQAVTSALTARLLETDELYRDLRERGWQKIWPGTVMPAVAKVEVLAPASVLNRSAGPNRLAIVVIGLGAGLVVGMVAAIVQRRPRAARRMAIFAAAGCAAGVAVSYLLPVSYISSAEMRISLPALPETPTETTREPSVAQTLLPIQRQVLSRGNLAALIQRPSLNLYPRLRARKPLEDVIEKMRGEDLRITPVGDSVFHISYSYPDDVKAQLVVREILSQFVEQYFAAARARAQDLKEDAPFRKIVEHKAGANLEVLDPASFPQSPAAPNRTVVTALGAALGLMLGALSLIFSVRSQRPPSPESC